MERLVFSKTFISSTFMRNKLLNHQINTGFLYLLPHVQGLLRQLVLVPGSDATHHICPSSDPQLAVLSVPPLLSDLHVIGRERDHHVTSYGNLQTHFTRRYIICFLASFPPWLSACLCSWPVRNRRAGISGVGAVVLRALKRSDVVQSAQERSLPLRRYCVDHRARG